MLSCMRAHREYTLYPIPVCSIHAGHSNNRPWPVDFPPLRRIEHSFQNLRTRGRRDVKV